ncbi:hypothetical protein M0Q97_07830 [Candidatus Dojkabacteria bacterium]|jgi:hypothetical protein|nr:hypothetical protein [Candidatus Dojkabacteria bacterium]
MVDLNKYKNNGWGLSKKCFDDIIMIINTIKSKPINVVEFGSGISTEFFIDLIKDGYDLNIISFDDNLEFACKIKHPNLKLNVTDLIECNDNDFIVQFQNRKYDKNFFINKTTPVETRQKNTFYEINNELPNEINLMVVDGPHGNGRSIAFLHGINKLKSGSYVVIDDYNHYDFVDKFKMVFSNSELIKECNTGKYNQWELGGNYVIYKII